MKGRKGYRENIEPTKDGFQELWDSIQNPTIEDLMAGIQSKRTTKKQLLDVTGDLRDSHTMLDKELLRLGEFSDGYNGKWAPKKIYPFGISQQLQAKTQSQLKRWREMLKLTSPRYKSQSMSNTQRSIYKESYLTRRPHELDIWGPASYGTLLYDLYDEMNVLIDHLEEGKQLCQDVMQKEQEINQNPEWKEELHDRQFQEIAEKNSDIIEKRYSEGKIDTKNRLYQEMVSSSSQREFKSNNFHKREEHEYVDYVVTVSTLRLHDNDITPTEHELWGDNFDKIKMKRFVVEHLDELIKVNKNGKFDKYETLELIKWCDVKESPKKHEDSERVLFYHIKDSYQGSHTWYGWPSVFTLNQDVKESVTESMTYAKRFQQKFNRFCVEKRINLKEITGEDNA
jgi:hypothetical protein